MNCSYMDIRAARLLGQKLLHEEWLATWESEAASDARHDRGDEMVKIAKGRVAQLQGSEADVVQRLIVQNHALIRIFHKLVH